MKPIVRHHFLFSFSIPAQNVFGSSSIEGPPLQKPNEGAGWHPGLKSDERQKHSPQRTLSGTEGSWLLGGWVQANVIVC